jgi:hypothetical protein
MKNFYLAALVAASLVACNSASSEKKAENTASTVTSTPTPTPTPTSAPVTAVDTVAKDVKSVDMTTFEGTKCYLLTEGKDVTAAQLSIKGSTVTGYFDWAPFEKDGGHGYLKGVREGNLIKADYTYMIEGSKNVEAVVFKMEGDKLLQAQGELVEKKGKLVIKDMAKVTYTTSLNAVDCAKIATNVASAKSAEKALQKM